MKALLSDPELGGTAFQVIRSVFRLKEGVPVPLSTVTAEAAGCVHPEPAEPLRPVDGEDRNEERIAVYTAYPLSTGRNDGLTRQAADRVRWGGRTWRVEAARRWETAGGYTRATAVLEREEA